MIELTFWKAFCILAFGLVVGYVIGKKWEVKEVKK
jgi:hypothetical protein